MKGFLALDLDGTLLNSQKELTPRTRQALLDAQARGLCIILASGRPVCGQRWVAEALQLQRFGGYLIAFNGGIIVECATGRELVRTTLPHHLLPQIIGEATCQGFDVLSYQGDVMLATNATNPYVQYAARINHMELRQFGHLPSSPEMEEVMKVFASPVPKCIVVGEAERLAVFEEEMKHLFPDALSIARSEPFFLEVMPAGVDKAERLRLLLNHLGATPDQLIACGDGYNDIGMIRLAGLGVAMGNACPPAKEAADYIAPSNDADGIAHVVKRFLSQEETQECE